ncbi:hypothetical protein MA9V1_029 [Chryseobacterium phage MA9V-1]|nr:hypothetical protein MA9V1_029 [Chryseobacterium phage MA9V-1]
MEDLAILVPGVESEGVYAFVEEINACLKTRPYEAILDYTAGRANGEFLIGETSLSAGRIIDLLKEDIQQKCKGSTKYAYTINVQFVKGNRNDMVVVHISINNPDNPQEPINYYHTFR